MQILARNKGLALQYRVEGKLPERLLGDSARLRQVLVNLIGNAVKFTHAGSVDVEIAAEPFPAGAGDRVELRVSVRDTGIGIPSGKQKLIFEPFRQADGSTTRHYGGTGLGLAICARLVELMDGRIRVESRLGEGSTFSFTAILGAPEKGESPPPHSDQRETVPRRSLRVLVAEDNPVNQKLAGRILRNFGHEVICANDGREAVEILGRDRFDIVLMDIQMPRMDGFEATLEIRKMDAALRVHTPILALTANAMKGDRERCLQAGMDGYVPKPLRPEELIRAMEEITNG
jgi:CheY-like chemotaxis protein/anti-sigma regulatory factor (Ser/Thr protein kinase)